MARRKLLRIRTIDVGRRGHHYIKIGVYSKKGKRGGRTKSLGGLRKYKKTTIKRMRRVLLGR